jgi:hypothetical protein
MRKWITLLVIVLAFSTVSGQNSRPQRQKQQFRKEAVKSSVSSNRSKELKDLSPARQEKVSVAQKKAETVRLKSDNVPQSRMLPIGQSLRRQSAVAAPVYKPVKSAADVTTARVILTAGDIWGDGSGYQLLLDADAVAYARIPLNSGEFNLPYSDFEYKIPTNADSALTTQNIVINNSIEIDIPAGTYDYFVTNPTPGAIMWIAGGGRGDDYEFEAGKTYEFTVTFNGESDLVTLTVVTVPTVPSAPTGFTVTPDAGGALSAVLDWTNPSLTLEGDPLTSITSIVIKRDKTVIQTINNPVPGAAGTYTDNTVANGRHTYTIYATNADGSGLVASTTVFVGIDPCLTGIATFPYREGAEEDLGCWSVWNVDGEGATWEVSNNRVHSGLHAFVHDYSSGNQDGWLISPKIIIPATGAYRLSFWSYNTDPSYYGKNSVLISTTNADPTVAGTYTEIWTPAAPPVSPAAWVESVVSLAAYAGQEIYLAFRYQGNYAHGWYLDDLSITEILKQDAGVTAITAPVNDIDMKANETVTVKVKNFGSENISNIPVYYKVGNDAPVAGVVPGPVAPDAEATFDFLTTADFSSERTYAIKAYTGLTGDTNTFNDTIQVSVTNVVCGGPVSTINEGFEDASALGCWRTVYDNANRTEVSDDVAHTGSQSWRFSSMEFAADYNAYLITPALTTTKAKHVSFFYTIYEASSYEDFRVGYSTGNADPASFIWVDDIQATPGGWKEYTHIFPADAKYIAVNYYSDYQFYLYVDDFTVSEIKEYDAAVTAIVSPVSGANLTATEPVKIKVRNVGAQPVNSLPVSFTVTGGETLNGTIAGPIESLAEVEYTFEGRTVDLSTAKDYSVKASVALPGDQNTANDALSATVSNYGNIVIMGAKTSATTCGAGFMDDGIYEDYSPGIDQIQTMTLYPDTPGDRVKVEFTEFASVPYELWWILEFPGDTLFVYEGNVATESKLLAALTGDLTGNLPAPFASYAADGSLTFSFHKYSGMADSGWEATISCYTPQPYDAGVSQILSPLKGSTTAAAVKVRIKNYGVNPLTSIPAAYKLNGGTAVTQTFTGNIAPGETADFTFTTPVDVSAYRSHTLEAYTLMPNDGDENNNAASVSFTHKESVTLYGYRIYDDNFASIPNVMAAVSFNTSDPSDVTTEYVYEDGDNVIYSGESVGDYIYVYSVYATQSAITAKHFIKLTRDWTPVTTKPITEFAHELTYDYSTGTLYAVTDSEDAGLELKTVDLETGALTTVAAITGVDYLYTLAADLNGTLYGVDTGGDLVTIDKTTGETTIIGNTGIEPNYLQSMTFDHNSERLFWAMSNSEDEGRLIELDPATGAVTDFGMLGGNAEIIGLHTPYSYLSAPELLSINIEDGATNVDPELSIILTFSQAITSTKLADITLKIGSDALSAVAVTPSISENVLTVAHAKLNNETTYDLLIPTGTIDHYDAEIALSFTTLKDVGIADIKGQSFSVYPNPAKNAAYISYVPENSVVSIKDATGRTVGSYTNLSGENVKLELPFTGGVYFIRISNNTTTTTQKLIIK